VTESKAGLLDTSTVVVIERLDPEELPAESFIAAITLAELSVGPLVTEDPTERALRQVRLQEVESSFDPLPFDASGARAFGQLAAQLRQRGRRVQARAFDTLIAATAIANDLPIYTCNPRDFAGIEGLEIVAIPHPDST
jgi:tRNA(fMet)-specific endonuclease VapC